MTHKYDAYWSPEGRRIGTYIATTLTVAKRMFRAEHRGSYARYMGEVYWMVDGGPQR